MDRFLDPRPSAGAFYQDSKRVFWVIYAPSTLRRKNFELGCKHADSIRPDGSHLNTIKLQLGTQEYFAFRLGFRFEVTVSLCQQQSHLSEKLTPREKGLWWLFAAVLSLGRVLLSTDIGRTTG